MTTPEERLEIRMGLIELKAMERVIRTNRANLLQRLRGHVAQRLPPINLVEIAIEVASRPVPNLIPPAAPPASRFKAPKMKQKVLRQSILDLPSEHECGICLEIHLKKDSSVCNCNHEFGTTCFSGWISSRKNTRQLVTCPTCRQQTTTVTKYQARRPRQKPAV